MQLKPQNLVLLDCCLLSVLKGLDDTCKALTNGLYMCAGQLSAGATGGQDALPGIRRDHLLHILWRAASPHQALQ